MSSKSCSKFCRKDNAFRWVKEEDGQVFEICDLSVKLVRASGKLRMVSNGELYMAVNESTKRIVATKNRSAAAILTFVPKRAWKWMEMETYNITYLFYQLLLE